MNSPKTGLRVASVFFGIFAIAHLLRLINHAQVTLGTLTIPMSLSWIALIVALILCVWLWRLSSRPGA
jgi:4-hydroxybenzoate polyprenyltransferase